MNCFEKFHLKGKIIGLPLSIIGMDYNVLYYSE